MNRFKTLLFSILMPIILAAGNFVSEEASVINHTDSITLAGTLTTPADSHPRAAIVMATGSGAQNRDEEIFSHKPFKVIAEYLAGNGYAVLRMDDRGTAHSEGDFTSATTDDFVTDIAAGLEILAERFPNMQKGVIGHSEGGTIAIKTASRNRLCSFIVTLAAPAWQGDSIIMSQSRAMAVGLTGKWDMETQQREILDIVKSDLNDLQTRMSLSFLLPKIFGESANLPQAKAMIAKQTDTLTSRWYRDMVRYNPECDIKAVGCPWLALNGAKDTQVLPANLETIKTLNPITDTKLLDGHNHLFQTCTTGLPDEYPSAGQSPSPETLAIILKWLNTTIN